MKQITLYWIKIDLIKNEFKSKHLGLLGVKRSDFDTILAILLYFHSIWLLNE